MEPATLKRINLNKGNEEKIDRQIESHSWALVSRSVYIRGIVQSIPIRNNTPY